MKIPLLRDITLEEVHNGLDTDTFSSVHLVQAYVARIKEVDAEFRSVLELNNDAETIARELDNERRITGRRGPLHGVPILLKDNIWTLDKTHTSAGSFALLGARPAHEAGIVSKLRQAGAIILGKANMSEWANFRSTNSSDGWSARGGQTLGAYYPNSSPEGSSSGSCVAVTLGLAFEAIGTETDGSIVFPAQFSNIVGIKPTVGLVSRDGVIPMSERQDSIGPVARTVKDAAHLLTVISGKNQLDKRTLQIPFDIPDYAAVCISTDLSKIRIGIPRNAILEVPASVLVQFEKAVELMSKAGASIIEDANLSSVEEWDDWNIDGRNIQSEVHFREAIEEHCKTLVANPNNIHNVDDIIAFTKSHPAEEYNSRNIDLWLGSATSEEIQENVKKMVRISGKEGILGTLEANCLDVLAAPHTPHPPVTFAARVGLPIITVPLGFYPPETPVKMNDRGNLVERAPGMPFSISFFGRAYSEQVLIKVTYAFEQLTNARNNNSPYRLPKTELDDVIRDSA